VFSLEVRAELCHHVPDLQMAYEQADVVVLARKFQGKRIEVIHSWKMRFPDPYSYSNDALWIGRIKLPERYRYPIEDEETKFLFLVHDEKHPAAFREIACSGNMDFRDASHREILNWIDRRALPDRVREWVDRVIQSFGQDDTPETREKIAEALLKRGRVVLPEKNPALIHDGMMNRTMYRSLYDEVDRRFREDELPAIRRMVAEMLFLKGISLIGSGQSPIPVFEEFEMRFGKNDDPAIRELYVKSLVEKGNASSPSDTDKAAAIYDDVVSRYAGDKSPTIRVQAAYALLLKARDLIGLHRDPEATFDEIERRFREDQAPEVQEMVLEILFEKARAHALRGKREMLLSVCDEINQRFGKGNAKIRVRIIRKLTLSGLYEQVVQRFGEDDDPKVQDGIVHALSAIGDRLQKKGDVKAAIAVYDEIDRRFGERRVVYGALDKKGLLLQRQGDLAAAFAVYDDITHRFGENKNAVLLSLFRKGEILEKQGKLMEAIALLDEIERDFGKDDSGFVSKAVKLRASIKARLSEQ
jgi:tetratricopeptide (TPR) repeat protein